MLSLCFRAHLKNCNTKEAGVFRQTTNPQMNQSQKTSRNRKMKPLCYLLMLTVLVPLLISIEGTCSLEGGEIDFATIGTRRILEAKHIVVGEVIDVSNVFQATKDHYSPISFVTFRVDLDIKNAIERAEKTSNAENQKPPADGLTLTFAQNGGPNPDGTWTEVAGIHLFKPGERVLLFLAPTLQPLRNENREVKVYSPYVHGYFAVEQTGKSVYENKIEYGWQRLDMTVLEIARIVRATLKQPERMRRLEQQVHELRKIQMPKEGVQGVALSEVTAIEAEFNLPSLEKDDVQQ